MLTADPVPLCYFFGKQICSFKCFIFCESHPILMKRFLFSDISALCGKVHGKTLCGIHCWTLAKFTEKYVFELSTHFQSIHSNTFILSRGFTLIVFSSYGRKNRRTRFVFDENNRF